MLHAAKHEDTTRRRIERTAVTVAGIGPLAWRCLVHVTPSRKAQVESRHKTHLAVVVRQRWCERIAADDVQVVLELERASESASQLSRAQQIISRFAIVVVSANERLQQAVHFWHQCRERREGAWVGCRRAGMALSSLIESERAWREAAAAARRRRRR